MPDGIIASQRTRTGHVLVVKDKKQIILYFGDPRENTAQMKMSGIMSRVSLDDPLFLLGLYTRVMMLSLAWCPNPRRVYMVGFGGGRIPMVLHHYLPDVVVESTEMETTVVQLAQRYFGIELGERMRVAVEEGREYLTRRSADHLYDMIMIDCFGGSGQHPFHLSTVEFYQLCKQRLRPGGVVTTNLSVADPLIKEKIATFSCAFKAAYTYESNEACILFGSSEPPLDKPALITRAQSLVKQFGFAIPLPEYAAVVKPTLRARGVKILHDSDAKALIPIDDPVFLGIGRNQPCPCGSGRKFKQCHGAPRQASSREGRDA